MDEFLVQLDSHPINRSLSQTQHGPRGIARKNLIACFYAILLIHEEKLAFSRKNTTLSRVSNRVGGSTIELA